MPSILPTDLLTFFGHETNPHMLYRKSANDVYDITSIEKNVKIQKRYVFIDS